MNQHASHVTYIGWALEVSRILATKFILFTKIQIYQMLALSTQILNVYIVHLFSFFLFSPSGFIFVEHSARNHRHASASETNPRL